MELRLGRHDCAALVHHTEHQVLLLSLHSPHVVAAAAT